MSTPSIETATPMMRQWHQCKAKAKNCLLLFRMGDFYEAFYEDAEILAKALNLTLTKRQEIPMSGIPHHALQNYTDRLLSAGLKIAIAEQTEDPKKAKGLVKRDLTRIITPGTLMDSDLIDAKKHNYCACLHQIGSTFALALIDITTGDFKVTEEDSLKALSEEVFRHAPKELLITSKLQKECTDYIEEWKRSFSLTISKIESWHFDPELTLKTLLQHFKVHSLDGFGLRGMSTSIVSAGALLTYLSDELCLSVDHVKTLKRIQNKDYLVLDHITLKHLEILQSQQRDQDQQTLFHFINQTKTPMGSRLLREWIQKPLLNEKEIHQRQDIVELLLTHPKTLDELSHFLSQIQDLERMTLRISTRYSHAKEFRSLLSSIEQLPLLKDSLKSLSSPLVDFFIQEIETFAPLSQELDKALVEDPPLKLGEGKTFKPGYSAKLDEWVNFKAHAKDWMANYQTKVREETQIKTLKVGYNRVFGYYLEVSKGQAHLMPSSFHRRQTLANNERFVSDELKTYESRVLQAEEKIQAIENEIFESLREKITAYSEALLKTSKTLAKLDALLSLALVAQKNRLIKPLVDSSSTLQIHAGAHPILDQMTSFIPNDTFLDDEDQRLVLITGPNMAGKSTYIRQVALLVILAQIGSYIPAGSAHIGIVDRIFTRIGASDDLSRGQSTFMVEMVETANILNHATNRSLVILDEIGRGTSTYDGIAIAQATLLYLLRKGSKTLFATHYSELTQLESKHKGIVNYTVAVHESSKGIQFLYKIKKGSTDKSYGIHVAELAGLPSSLIQEAKKLLSSLEKKPESSKKASPNEQLTFFEAPKTHPILEEIKHLNLNQTTPLEALTKLMEVQKQLL